MKRKLLPYYLSRALLAGLLGYAISTGAGIWLGIIIGLVVFAGFVGYAHSGWFLVDSRNPLFPLRRDARGKAIRDRAIVLAVGIGGLAYFILSVISMVTPLQPQAGSLSLTLGALSYFFISFWLFIRQ
jgi:hypothetical protein